MFCFLNLINRCVLSSLALLVLIGTTYHSASNHHKTIELETPQRKTKDSKHVYEQSVEDHDDGSCERNQNSVVSPSKDEKHVRAQSIDVPMKEYSANDNRAIASSVSNGTKEAFVQENRNSTSSNKLGMFMISCDV